MGLADGWRRREIGIRRGGSLRRPRPTQGCSAEEDEEEEEEEEQKKKKKKKV
jgi:hypothetical protein